MIHDYDEEIETYIMIVGQSESKDENFKEDRLRRDRKHSWKLRTNLLNVAETVSIADINRLQPLTRQNVDRWSGRKKRQKLTLYF